MKEKIGIFGGGGLIGNALSGSLILDYDVSLFKSSILYSSPHVIVNNIQDLDIVINLCGYPVSGRWSPKRKELIHRSRILTTTNLVSAIGLLKFKNIHLINASAVGIYKDHLLVDESSGDYAENFLAGVVKDWETAVSKAADFGIDYSILRFGVVLSRKGGAYKLLRNLFRLGLGGIIGNGKQGFSFIFIDDLTRIVHFIISSRMTGVLNVVSPTPVTNEIFTKELSNILSRKAFFHVPAFLVKLMYGEGSIILLNGQKVLPGRLIESNFSFIGINLKTCLTKLEK